MGNLDDERVTGPGEFGVFECSYCHRKIISQFTLSGDGGELCCPKCYEQHVECEIRIYESGYYEKNKKA